MSWVRIWTRTPAQAHAISLIGMKITSNVLFFCKMYWNLVNLFYTQLSTRIRLFKCRASNSLKSFGHFQIEARMHYSLFIFQELSKTGKPGIYKVLLFTKRWKHGFWIPRNRFDIVIYYVHSTAVNNIILRCLRIVNIFPAPLRIVVRDFLITHISKSKCTSKSVA